MRHLAYCTLPNGVKLSRMKAIRVHQFGDPSVMKLEEVPDTSAGAGQVLVDVKAAGVNPVDTYIRSGQYASLPPLPYTPGSDAAGVVAAVGGDVHDVQGGRSRVHQRHRRRPRVRLRTPSARVCTIDQVHHLPATCRLPKAPASAFPTSPHGARSSTRARAMPGETVLIHGASGAVGVAATQMASAAGLRVFGTAGTERGRQLAREQGAHEVFDHSARRLREGRSLAKTGGRGVDLVIEMLANVNLVSDLDLIAKRGRIAIVGNRGALELNPARDHGEGRDGRRLHELERAAGRARHGARRDRGRDGAFRIQAAGRQGDAARRCAARARRRAEARRLRKDCTDSVGCTKIVLFVTSGDYGSSYSSGPSLSPVSPFSSAAPSDRPAGKAAGEQELRSVRDELSEAQRRLAVSESRNVAYGEAEKILKDTFSALAGSALTSNSEQFLQRAEERFKNLQVDTTAELDKRKVRNREPDCAAR